MRCVDSSKPRLNSEAFEPMGARSDHLAIIARVGEGRRVLDVGCGDGAVLALLRIERKVDARGLELSSDAAGQALARGLSVIQGDAETDLELFPDDAFDVAILSRTLQEMRRPGQVLEDLARIAPEMIVSFRNYGRWTRRLSLLSRGRMPGRDRWHSESGLHPCTCADMVSLARELGLEVIAAAPVTRGQVGTFRSHGLGWLNLKAEDVILHLGRKAGTMHRQASTPS